MAANMCFKLFDLYNNFFGHLHKCSRVDNAMIAGLYLLIQISLFDTSFQPCRDVLDTNLIKCGRVLHMLIIGRKV